MKLMQKISQYRYWIMFNGILLGLYSLLLLYLLSDGTFRINKQYYFTQVFPDMWDQLLKGRVDSNWRAIRDEAFVVNQRYIAYFLPFPAFVRGLLSLVGLKYSAIASQIAASLVFVISSLSIYVHFVRKVQLGNLRLKNFALYFGSIWVVMCSPITILATYPMSYWESIAWGCALYMLSLATAIYTLDSSRQKYFVYFFSIISGCIFFTRPTFALANTLLVVYIFSVIAFQTFSKYKKGATNAKLLAVWIIPLLIYMLFGVALGYFNYLKWGSPWVFQSIENYTLMWTEQQIAEFLRFGNFRLDRIPEAIVFYFLPSANNFSSNFPYIQQGINNLFGGFAEHIGYREPAIPLLMTLPVFIGLVCIGIFGLARDALAKIEFLPNQNKLLVVSMIGILPGLVMLPFYSFAVRYQGEFLPGITLISVIGLVKILSWVDKSNSLEIKRPYFFSTTGARKACLAFFLVLATIYLEISASKIQQTGWLKNAAYIQSRDPIEIGKKINFCKGCNGIQYLNGVGAKPIMGSGWAYPEEWGVWSDGQMTSLTFELPEDAKPSKLFMTVMGYVPKKGAKSIVEISVNGVPIQSVNFNNFNPKVLEIKVPPIKEKNSKFYNQLTLEFHIKTSFLDSATGVLQDNRQLGVGLIEGVFAW